MRRTPASLLAALALVGAGCSPQEDPALPAACRLGTDAVRAALEDAPGDVLIGGGTPLSNCIVPEADQADMLLVGEVYLGAATQLADEGEALQLGYLLGAVKRGARRTGGIHEELMRRLESETARVEDRVALRRGERAGLESG